MKTIFLVHRVHSILVKIRKRKKQSISLPTMEFNGFCSKKTHEKWYIRPPDPAKRWEFTDEAAKCVQEKVVTEERFQDTRDDERTNLNLLKSPGECSVAGKSNLNQFLNEILMSEAKFPDSAEAKEIFEEMDQIVAMMCLSLQKNRIFSRMHCKKSWEYCSEIKDW